MKKEFLLIIICFSLWSCSKNKTTTVGIQPLDHFDNTLIDTISKTLHQQFGFKIYTLPRKPIPKEAFTKVKSPRYRADKILIIAKNEKPDSLDYIIAFTAQDISTTKKDNFGNTKEPLSKYSDWGILGLGYKPGPCCIVSTFRLKSTTKGKFIERLKKVAVHEIGHNLGLDHCTSKLCVMRDAAETIKTIDLVRLELCKACRRKLDL